MLRTWVMAPRATLGCLLLIVWSVTAVEVVGAEVAVTDLGALGGNWALKMPNGSAGWMTLSVRDGALYGELWTVGSPKRLTHLELQGKALRFQRKCRVGKPEFPGGPPSGDRVACQHVATSDGKTIRVVMHQPTGDGQLREVAFHGKRLSPLPPRPDLAQLKFGPPIQLFNGRDLTGWKLTNDRQLNGWKAVDGVLVNTTPKLDFQPYSRYGNLRTVRAFTDFRLEIDFRVPPGGNSGIYLRGMYEAQVVDRDSKMQGIYGVGAIFGRIAPRNNAGRAGGQWQHYDIILVDRHVTVVLNGTKVIDNQPIPGCTNGALQADESLPGPLYLQGDHTAVSYRNIILHPILKD